MRTMTVTQSMISWERPTASAWWPKTKGTKLKTEDQASPVIPKEMTYCRIHRREEPR